MKKRIDYLKRGLSWTWHVCLSLSDFWRKNPGNSLSILRFIAKKFLYFPKFLTKNVTLEKQEDSYKNILEDTVKLYNKYGKNFDHKSNNSYKKLAKHFTKKQQILYFLARKIKPKVVVETGVASGESTGFLLQALMDNNKGKLYSIDLPFQWYTYGKNKELHLDSLPPGMLPGYIVPKILKKRWKFIFGDTYKELPKLLEALDKIDIFFHDSEHTDKTMTFEYNTSWPHITKNGLLLSDDVDFTRALDNFAKRKNIKPLKFMKVGILQKKID